MKKQFAVAVFSLVTAFSGVVPANAFPSVVSAPKVDAPADVQQVQYRRYGGYGGYGWRGGPRYYGNRYYGGRYYGHRYYGNNYWGPGAALGGFAAGAIIGGALAQPYYQPYYGNSYVAPRRYVGASAHVNWCYGRYRSYRAYDNTFQPNYGPRQQCYSPY